MSEKKFAMSPGQFAALVATILNDVEIVDGLDEKSSHGLVRIFDFIGGPISFRKNSYDSTAPTIANYRSRTFRQDRIIWLGKEIVAFRELK